MNTGARWRRLGVAVGLLIVLSGCFSNQYSYGRKYDETKVEQIETTTAQIVEWFGQPLQKHTLSEDEEKWIYMYMEGEAKATGFVVVSGESKGTTKALDLFVRDGIVVNFTYNVGEDKTEF